MCKYSFFAKLSFQNCKNLIIVLTSALEGHSTADGDCPVQKLIISKNIGEYYFQVIYLKVIKKYNQHS